MQITPPFIQDLVQMHPIDLLILARRSGRALQAPHVEYTADMRTITKEPAG